MATVRSSVRSCSPSEAARKAMIEAAKYGTATGRKANTLPAQSGSSRVHRAIARAAPTQAGLAAQHHGHPNVIAQGKRKAQESLPDIFAKKADRTEAARDAELKELHAKIGQLSVENDFLSKAFGR